MIVLKHLKKQPFHLGTHVLRETSIENTKIVFSKKHWQTYIFKKI